MRKYVDVVIADSSFYIVESFSKPRTRDSALETLKKIEWVVKNKLTYVSNARDIYSNKSQSELFDILKLKSSQILEGYQKKQSKLNWVFQKIFSKVKEIKEIHIRIDKYIQNAPHELPLSNKSIQDMSKLNKYFDVFVLNNSFYITESFSFSKPRTHDLALETLKKIELIFKNKLKYDSNHHDIYSDKTINELFGILIEKSSQIHEKYKTKRLKLNWIFQKIFKKEKEITEVHTRIDKYIQSILHPPAVIPLPNELIQEVTKHLGVLDLGVLAQINCQGKIHAATAIVRKAKEFGFEGSDHPEAIKYINELFDEVVELAQKRVIAENHLFYKKNLIKFNSERILQNLQNLLTNDLFTFLSNEIIYLQNFQKIRKIFSLKGNWQITKTSEHFQEKGNTALFFSIFHNDKKIPALLLQHGADPNIFKQHGLTPLRIAVLRNNFDNIKLLLTYKARVNEREIEKNTVLNLECGYRREKSHQPNLKVIELLLQHSADIHIPDENGSPPLHHAAQRGYSDLVKRLLECGATVNARGSGLGTALAYACGFGNREIHEPKLEVVQILLQHHADPNIPDQSGCNSLHHAAQAGYAKIVDELLKHGARVNERGAGRGTALVYACGYGNKERHKVNLQVVKLLLQYKAHPNIPDENGVTPLKIAQENHYHGISYLLLDSNAQL